MSQALPRNSGRDAILALLLVAFLILNCVSLTEVLHNSVPGHPNFWVALAITLSLAVFFLLFVRTPFSFGYFIGFNFYCLITGYMWLSYFVSGSYDHTLA